MGEQKGEQILSAGEGSWSDIIIMECRLGRNNR